MILFQLRVSKRKRRIIAYGLVTRYGPQSAQAVKVKETESVHNTIHERFICIGILRRMIQVHCFISVKRLMKIINLTLTISVVDDVLQKFLPTFGTISTECTKSIFPKDSSSSFGIRWPIGVPVEVSIANKLCSSVFVAGNFLPYCRRDFSPVARSQSEHGALNNRSETMVDLFNEHGTTQYLFSLPLTLQLF